MTPLFKSHQARIAFVHDMIMAGLSLPLALYLRIGNEIQYYPDEFFIQTTGIFVLICAPVFWFLRLYRGIWRYASMNDLVAITRAVTVAVLIFLPILFSLNRLELVPRSLPVINWIVLIAMLGGPRFFYRLLKDRHTGHLLEKNGYKRLPVMLIGAGDEAELFLREQSRDHKGMFKAVALISEKPRRVGHTIHGVPVIGTLKSIQPDNWKSLKQPPQKIILTKDNIEPTQLRKLFEMAQAEGITVARLPKLSELKAGIQDEKMELRPIAVEDLLGRAQTTLDRPAMKRLVTGKRVLVTGAGGSIGSELVRQISALEPASLALLDNSEYQLYLIDQEIGLKFPDLPRLAMLGDVRDRDRIDDVMQRTKPELVFHAAAFKHVPLVEENPMEGILTNVVGSRIVADACRKAGVNCMVQISTDKAVNPTNVMGATKRLAEEYIQASDTISRRENGTRFVVVRFGNVLGSTGSVVPLFQKQLAAGGPLTVTHPEVTRFFMTIREAVELVLQASVLGSTDDSTAGRIFVLDMGQPVKIADLARQIIMLAGLKPDEDIKIEYTGLRPGEKLYEELLHNLEKQLPTVAEGIMLAAPRTSTLEILREEFDILEKTARKRDRQKCLENLCRLVPEYRPDNRTVTFDNAATPPLRQIEQ
ncbi:polysaccharide biosynthesis protein [Aestuariispira insulae]|uniref:O-antigen biosynthesis protein WbqV n=1 Tax=Aestuariispira insulae TaxID=1461337 RepID=A0A3D9HIA0_9PROT|nr:nucleoside-diphosphate sugar epimerase/dehydratase [Aestuariispira insulae]RED49210.1 O-antigen biosynthesis protein WbqV [Aestuariispira insulae]